MDWGELCPEAMIQMTSPTKLLEEWGLHGAYLDTVQVHCGVATAWCGEKGEELFVPSLSKIEGGPQ